MAEKSFFRVRVKETCPYPAVMVKNLGKVTKTWQLKKGDAADYAEYPNLDVQPMIKEGGAFIPATVPAAESEPPAPQAGKTAFEPEGNDARAGTGSYGFSGMSVEQLKAWLATKGVPAGELRGMAKADLVARAEAAGQAENGNA